MKTAKLFRVLAVCALAILFVLARCALQWAVQRSAAGSAARGASGTSSSFEDRDVDEAFFVSFNSAGADSTIRAMGLLDFLRRHYLVGQPTARSLGLQLAPPLTVALVALVYWTLFPVITACRRSSSSDDNAQEAVFVANVATGETKLFDSLAQEPVGTVGLTVVVPAYNEEKRLPIMLDTTIRYLEQRALANPGYTWEIIVVDDGSVDGTVAKAHAYTKSYTAERVRLLRLARNHGKGGAVRKGVLRARGENILMADADGATTISCLDQLEATMARLREVAPAGGVVCGSRAHMMEAEAQEKREGIRGFVSQVFNLLVTTLVPGPRIRDTQCGFKLFSRDVARKIFPSLRFWGWSFDVELLFLASRHKFQVAEDAVEWRDVEGSKLSVVSASAEMLRDLLLMALMYRTGVWS